MFEIKEGTLSAGKQKLFDNLTFTVENGMTTAVFCEDARALFHLGQAFLAFQPLTSGYVSFEGELMTPLSAPYFRRQISYVPSSTSFPATTVGDLFHEMLDMKEGQEAHEKSALMREWDNLNMEKSLFDAMFSTISEPLRRLILLSFAMRMNRSGAIIDQSLVCGKSQYRDLIAGMLRKMAARQAAVLMLTTDEQMALSCDKQIKIPISE